MKLTSGLAALLIATSIVGGGFVSGCGSLLESNKQAQILEPLKPLKVEEIDKIASEITVLIDGSSSGSGVLIAKEKGWFDTTYYVLTAKHVIQGQNEFDIVTPDGERYRRSQNDVVEYLPNADLAVVQFASNKSYSLARVTDWDFQNASVYFEVKDKAADLADIFVSGFPDPKQESEFTQPKRLLTTGKVISATDSPFGDSDYSLNQGYEFTYGAVTYRGMSGSPILDTSGRLIGIHGRNTGEQIEGNRRIILGDSIGVPISKLLKTSSGKLQKLIALLAVDQSPPLKNVNDVGEYRMALLAQEYQTISKNCRDDRCLNYISRLIRRGAYKDASQLVEVHRAALQLIEAYLSIDENKKFYPAWYLRGNILTVFRQYEAALASFEQSVQLNPDFHPAKLAQCSILWSRLKQYEKAVTACDQGIAIIQRLKKNGILKGEPFSMWHQKAQALENMGRNKEAIEQYNIAISILPNPHSYLNRGSKYFNLKNYKAAVDDWTKAIELNPKYTQAYTNRGKVRLDYMSDQVGASQDFDMAAKISPEYTFENLFEQTSWSSITSYTSSSSANQSPSIVLLRNKAIQIVTNLITQKSDSPKLSNWYYKRCSLQVEINAKIAMADCNKSIELDPKSIEAYFLRAQMYYHLGDYQKSLSDYQKHIELSPKSRTFSLMQAYFGKCQVLMKKQQFESALKECQIALKIHPDEDNFLGRNKAEVYAYTAFLYSQLSNNEMALESISSAIKLNPHNAEYYIDRHAIRVSLMKVSTNLDTGEWLSLAPGSVDNALGMVEDLEKASKLGLNETLKKHFKSKVQSHIQNFSRFSQPDETVQNILARLKKLE